MDCVILVIILVVVTGVIYLLAKDSFFEIRSGPLYTYTTPSNNFILKPANYRRLPWARKTFFNYPFFNRRYVTRPILTQAL